METLFLAKTPPEEIVRRAVTVLAAGGLIIFPTETTYGAGVDATNQAAVDTLLKYKARREGKPLSIGVADAAMAKAYVEVNAQAAALYERFLPGPVTVISKSLGKVAHGVASEFGTIGIRIPDYPLLLDIIRAFGKPLTTTSANASDAKRPYSVTDILENISESQRGLIDLVIDAGELPHNPPSTVIDTTLSTPIVFRQGDIHLPTTPESQQEGMWNLTSHSPAETQEIAQRILLKYWNDVRATGIVIGLDGSLGMGKTIFVKGAADFLLIKQTITSPTYTYRTEYPFTREQTNGTLYHLDLWKIETPAELERLEVEQMIKPNAIVIIEWASNGVATLRLLAQRHHAPLVHVMFDRPAISHPDARQIRVWAEPSNLPSTQ